MGWRRENGDLVRMWGTANVTPENVLETLSKLMTETDEDLAHLSTQLFSSPHALLPCTTPEAYCTTKHVQNPGNLGNSISSAHCLSPSFILNTVPCLRIAFCHSIHKSTNFLVSLEKVSKDLD